MGQFHNMISYQGQNSWNHPPTPANLPNHLPVARPPTHPPDLTRFGKSTVFLVFLLLPQITDLPSS